MSLLEELTADLRRTARDLPLATLCRAAGELGTAADLFRHVLAASVAVRPVPTLAGATEHLEAATGALHRAQDAIDTYLAAIGASTPATGPAGPAEPRPDPAPRDATDPETVPGRSIRKSTVDGLTDWWAVRIAELTGFGGRPGEPPAQTPDPAAGPAELLRRMVVRAHARDRAGIRAELVAAGPATGLGLSGTALPILGRLAADLLGHRAGPDDLDSVDTATRGRTGALLPGLPEPVIEALNARLCGLPSRPATGTGANNPADQPVALAVMVAALLRRLGRDATVVTEPRRAGREHA